MTRKLVASVLAFSLAISSAAVPARAGSNDDFNRFIAGAITLFILNKAFEDSRTRKPDVSRNPHPGVPAPPRFRGYLPSECFFTLRTRKGKRGVYGQACLNEVMYRPERLPRVCLDTVRVKYGRPANVYGAKCLQRRGFKSEVWQR